MRNCGHRRQLERQPSLDPFIFLLFDGPTSRHVAIASFAMSGILNPLLDLPAPLATGIAPRAAHLLCFTFTGGYVGSLYLAEALFGQKPNDKQLYSYPPPGHRDHPETMKRRMKAASVATGLALVGVYLTVAKENGFRWKEAVS